jgi:septal ring factor EnvC (AmiA/AmiB activator)
MEVRVFSASRGVATTVVLMLAAMLPSLLTPGCAGARRMALAKNNAARSNAGGVNPSAQRPESGDDLRARVKTLEHEKIQLLHKLITVEANGRRQTEDLRALETERDSLSKKLAEKQENLEKPLQTGHDLVEQPPPPEKNGHDKTRPLLQEENLQLGQEFENLRTELQSFRHRMAKVEGQRAVSRRKKSPPASNPEPVLDSPVECQDQERGVCCRVVSCRNSCPTQDPQG